MHRLQCRRTVLLGFSALALIGCDDESQGKGRPTPPSTLYFPPHGGDLWEQADPVATGWSPDGLATLIDTVEANRSSSFMVLVGGRILVEAYFMGASASTATDVASVQKSFTSTLVGLARDQGLLDLDDPVSDYLAAGWSNASAAEESVITLRHLLTHSSGLSPNQLTKVAEPGTVFTYNTNAYQKLRVVLEAASGMGINELSRAWFFDAIGVVGSWVDRGVVDPTGAAIWGLQLSARDMARFGLFAQRSGAWSSGQVTSPGWFAEAWTSSAVKADYGLLWWLQGKGTLKGKAPPDLVSALGARDQKIYVAPSLDVVVTRQGLAAGAASEAESNFDVLLLSAIAAARA